MNVTRDEVMYYSALVFAIFTLGCGFMADVGMTGVAWSCAFIAIVAAASLLLSYLEGKS